MTRDEVFECWAPAGAAWSPWAKPVLYAHFPADALPDPANPPTQDGAAAAAAPPPMDPDWIPPADGSSAVVVDLHGPAGVAAGRVLAEQGYRPVPLYNAAPGPAPVPFGEDGPAAAAGAAALVEVVPILGALWRATPGLRSLELPPDAPPAFLLDAGRRGGARSANPGSFDNRSVSLPTDFPSANLLLSRGVRRAVVVQPTGAQPQADLRHTLLRWQRAGIEILLKSLDAPGAPAPCTVRRPSWFGVAWYRMLAVLGLRRNPMGGFGGTIPEPSAG